MRPVDLLPPMVQEYFSSESVCGINAAMEFIPLHFADRLTVINPQGTIGVVTLWSKVDYVIERFRQAGVDLDPATSPIAVFGTLYGNGLREMLRNLLYNPQIQPLLICGHDRSGSAFELSGFFNPDFDLEPVANNLVRYKSPLGINKVSILKIAGSNRLIDDLVKPGQFKFFPDFPKVEYFLDVSEEEVVEDIRAYFEKDIIKGKPVCETDRKVIPLPEVEVQYFPSNPRGHLVVQDSILGAWKEVLYLLTRFGHRVDLKKGERLELQHVKVVVEKPKLESEKQLEAVNLDLIRIYDYQEEILRGEMRPDETYNYGHRLRTYFGLDTLAGCADRLRRDPEDRKSYVSLWDSARDLMGKEGRPCLVSLYFRKFEGKLTLSATFRTHNAMDAYPMNLYGLLAIQGLVADQKKDQKVFAD